MGSLEEIDDKSYKKDVEVGFGLVVEREKEMGGRGGD